ncbi:MAG: winged helix-turn-helix transcriptional regulator [Clostridia bacterium]|nr:winged helix-turn-helix transcriptional regulator [Clostridia bacterium]
MIQRGFDRFSSLINTASKGLLKIKLTAMRDYDLGSAHTACLRYLYLSRNGLTQNQISKKCEVNKAQTSRVLSNLIEKNYVVSCEGDKIYNKIYMLTPEGQTIARDINRRITEICDFVSGDIPDEDLKEFYFTLEKICNRIRESEKVFFDNKK